MCLEEECINNEEMIDKTVSIRTKLERAMEVKELVMKQNSGINDEFRRVMHEAEKHVQRNIKTPLCSIVNAICGLKQCSLHPA